MHYVCGEKARTYSIWNLDLNPIQKSFRVKNLHTLHRLLYLRDHIGPVGGQGPQILLLGHLRPLLVGALALRVQRVPRRRHDLRHFAKISAGISHLDRGLRVAKEQGVSGHRLLRLVGIALLSPFGRFGFFSGRGRRRCGQVGHVGVMLVVVGMM